MTEPIDDPTILSQRKHEGEDPTELSERNKEGEDITQLSERVRSQLSNDADEYTLMSARHLVADEDTADATRLSRRAISDTAKAPVNKPKLPSLPPGALGGAVAQRGSFGTPAEEYIPRAAPQAPPARPERAASVPLPEDLGVQAPGHSRARREAARHKRLITAAIVVGITAAIMTLAVIAIVAMLGGQE
jgi:hypothetical protein